MTESMYQERRDSQAPGCTLGKSLCSEPKWGGAIPDIEKIELPPRTLPMRSSESRKWDSGYKNHRFAPDQHISLSHFSLG